jgi:hypothetical protein
VTSPTIARAGQESTGYVNKGRALFEERFEEFRYLGDSGKWLIPSATVEGRLYEVSTRREGWCECRGYGSHGHCCHLIAGELARVKSGFCEVCGERFLNRCLYEVHEDHESLTWHPGQRLCEGCAAATGIL